LTSLFHGAGLEDVKVPPIDATIFKDFEDYWTPFLGGQAPAPRVIACRFPKNAVQRYATAFVEACRQQVTATFARLRERGLSAVPYPEPLCRFCADLLINGATQAPC
jgi:hypothetical protein